MSNEDKIATLEKAIEKYSEYVAQGSPDFEVPITSLQPFDRAISNYLKEYEQRFSKTDLVELHQS
jgi:hypothetical protein